MGRVRHWRAGATRAGRVRRRNSGGRRLRAAVAAGAMVSMVMPVLSADGAVGAGRSIEVFTGSDLIILTGYPPNTNVRVEVLRHGIVVGYATKRTDSLGGIEMNHVGGLAGDCFESPTSPDVQPSDTIRATVQKPGGATDTSVVRGVWITEMEFSGTTITVSGRVALDGPAAVDPAAGVLELRINKDTDWFGTGRSDLRVPIGASVTGDGSWTHVITSTASDVAEAGAGGETVLEWSDATASELTIAEFGEPEPLEGCPPPAFGPTAPQLLDSQDSGKVGDHVTNQATDLTFSGLAGTGVLDAPGPGQAVTLQVDGTTAAETTADADGVYRFTGVSLPPRATPHTLTVISPQGVASRGVTVDTAAPGVRVRSLGPTPLQLAGPVRLRASYAVNERSTLMARVVQLDSSRTVRTFDQRTVAAGPVEFTWDGKNGAGRDVQPGGYQLVLQATDNAGNVSVQRNSVRVVR